MIEAASCNMSYSSSKFDVRRNIKMRNENLNTIQGVLHRQYGIMHGVKESCNFVGFSNMCSPYDNLDLTTWKSK